MCAGSMQHEVSGLQLKRSECRVPVDDPERFRLEIMFSSGAQHNPYQHRPLMSHTMSISPREMLHKGVALRPRVQCSMFGMWLKIRRSVPLLACMIGCPSPASCLEPSSLLPQTAGCCLPSIHCSYTHAYMLLHYMWGLVHQPYLPTIRHCCCCAGDGLSWQDVEELLSPVGTPPKCATALNQSLVPAQA